MKSSNIALEFWRNTGGFLRMVALTVAMLYLFVFYSPSAMAMLAAKEHYENRDVGIELMNSVEALRQHTSKYLASFTGKEGDDKLAELNEMRVALAEKFQRYVSHSVNIIADQKDEAEHALRKQLSEAVKTNDVQKVKLVSDQLSMMFKHYHLMMEAASALGQADFNSVTESQELAGKLHQSLASIKLGPAPHQYNSEILPFGPLSSAVHEPAPSVEALQDYLGLLSQSNQANARTVSSYASDPASDMFLQFNEDNQVTERLTQLATELNHDPLAIYNYVYNTIEYVPAHGSIQGADYTLFSKRGGAIDQASLLVSLLRASNTPARYVYGSVEVDISQSLNWVGGVRNVEALQNLLGQGGVPNVLITDHNGVAKRLKMEHVWAEAQIEGQWVALDPSFKQYTHEEGIDLNAAMDTDPDQLYAALTAAADVDHENKTVRGLDQAYAAQLVSELEKKVEDYIQLNHPNAKFNDIAGEKKIVKTEAEVLPVALPYISVVASQPLAQLPSNIRHKFGFTLNDNYLNTHLNVEMSLPALAGKTLALHFTPATQADIDMLNAKLPQSESEATSSNAKLPYGLIQMDVEFLVDTQVVATGNRSFSLGEELNTSKGFWTPRFGWEKTDSPVIAGEYQAIGIDYHGIEPGMLADLKAKNAAVSQQLGAGNIDTLTKHDTVGLFLQTGIHSYYAMVNLQQTLLAKSAKVVNYIQPSYGTFSTDLSVSYFFGVPRWVSPGGLGMDIDRLANNAEAANNCLDDWRDYHRKTGAVSSYLENLVPEKMLDDGTNNPQGISAVKALGIAGQQGQKIYTLTNSNQFLLSEIAIDDEARAEINSAIASGKDVIVHEKPVSVVGWTGSGYIITDPVTGSGAYKISGGENGGYVSDEMAVYFSFIGFGIGLISTSLALMISLLIAGTLLIELWLDLMVYDNGSEFCRDMMVSLFVVIGLLPFLLGLAGLPIIGFLGLYIGIMAGLVVSRALEVISLTGSRCPNQRPTVR